MEKSGPGDLSGQLAGGATRVADLVAYQEEAVVSRTLIKKGTGTVTVFAFDRGQSLSEHTVAFDALVQLLDGEAQITLSGTPHHLKQGDMIVMPANQPHAVRAVTRFKMLLVMIRS
ncbi:MAG: cupin domain-containing protein [Planctomycetota bacterium]